MNVTPVQEFSGSLHKLATGQLNVARDVCEAVHCKQDRRGPALTRKSRCQQSHVAFHLGWSVQNMSSLIISGTEARQSPEVLEKRHHRRILNKAEDKLHPNKSVACHHNKNNIAWCTVVAPARRSAP